MDIGIIGSGNIGGTLARRFRELGHQVKIANSHGPESLAAFAVETGATAATVEEAARAKDLVIVTIPEAAVPELPDGLLADTWAVVVDTGNYYPSRDGRIAEIDGGMIESEWVAQALGHPAIKAFNNIFAEHLGTKGAPAGTPARIALPVAGDDPRSKELVIGLIDELGFDGVDAGTIADSWRQQPGTPVYASDLEANGVKAALAEADAGRIAEYREQANEAARGLVLLKLVGDRMAKFRIGLGVSGGIAAYKAVEVMRLLQRSGCRVSVTMTRHATEFVQPLTFRALTESHVIVDDYDPANPDPIAHINFSQNIDLLLVVPATANIIAKFANGIADDFLSSTYLACMAPMMIAPAMNTTMWEQPATQRNIEQLKADGVHFVEPVAGELACRTVGTGKLEDVENIVAQALALLTAETQRRRENINESRHLGDSAVKNDLSNERVLITVGGTREAIDPVRFISNHSSGKMGYAVAEAAAARGADVTVVAGMTTVDTAANVKVFRAISAAEMHDAVMRELPNATIFIGAAAVADYAPANAAEGKIKKDGRDFMILELKKTPDILSEVSKHRTNGLLVVGFAAETSNVVDHARSKLKKKGLDMVVANDITKEGAGFNTDTNIATIISKNAQIDLPLMPKRELADKILDEILKLRKT